MQWIILIDKSISQTVKMEINVKILLNKNGKNGENTKLP